jgi:NADPH:quinone reductase-like Zn-dependent oxidoreductase
VPEVNAVEIPGELDPAEVVSLVLPYMTAYQLLHRTAKVDSGEIVLVHGAAGRVGTAVLELGTLAGLRLYGTCSGRDRAAVERLGAVAIDYANEDFLARMRSLPEKGADVVLDGLGGGVSLRSFRALRRGGRLVLYGHYAALSHGRKSWRGWIEWYGATAGVAAWSLLTPHRRMLVYRIQKLREGRQLLPVGIRRALPVGGGPRDPLLYRQDFRSLLELLRAHRIHPVVAKRLPLTEARRAHELLEQSASLGKLVLVP